MSREVMKECCSLCPYSRKNTLYLHPERAEDFVYSAQNPYNDFVCQKTAELQENEEESDELVRGEKSLTCCGFATLQYNENGSQSLEGFEPDLNAFSDVWEMIETHEEKWNESHKSIREISNEISVMKV